MPSSTATLGDDLTRTVMRRIVVGSGFSSMALGQPFGINGRISHPLDFWIRWPKSNAFTLGPHNTGHPLMAGVTTLNSNFPQT